MNLKELKTKVLTLIEESGSNLYETSDTDISNKLIHVINQILFELSRYKKIPAYEEIEVKENDTFDLNDLDNFYQLNQIKDINYEIINENTIRFLEEGKSIITYYKYPTRLTTDTKSDFKLELSNDALEIAPYGIAADILKSDVSNQYGQIYSQRYTQMIQMLDSRYCSGTAELSEGIEI